MPTTTTIDYNSILWLTVECLIQQHCFGTISYNLDKRTEQLSEERPSHILAAITAAASHISQYPGYHPDNGIRRLIRITISEKLPMLIVEAIGDFLSSIGDYPSPTATDYVATIQSVRDIPVAKSSVHDAVAHASKLHGAQGQLAYDLLKSASLLLQAADATLKHDGSYAMHKLHTATRSLTYATKNVRRWQPHLLTDEETE